jgi:tetratricopeptide (TPR) repeat protein
MGSLPHQAHPQPDEPSSRRKAGRTAWLRFGIVALITAGLLYAVAPTLAGLFRLQRGAATLARVEQTGADPAMLAASIGDLQRAAELLPADPLPLRYLARAYQQSGRPEEAIAALERAASLVPQSILVRQELLLAYQTAGRQEQSAVLETELGYTPEQGIAIGDTYLANGDHALALLWYDRVCDRWPERTEQLAFRRLVAAIPLNDPRAPALLRQAQATLPGFEAPHVGTQPIVVNGAALRWVGDVSLPDAPAGTPLNYPYDGSQGVFWWEGRGTLIVAVDQPDTYLLRITTYNSKPPPIELAFGVNGNRVHYASLTTGDETWLVVEFSVTLHPPLASLDVWFLNNAMVNGQDRNAIIGSIEILKAHPGATIQVTSS